MESGKNVDILVSDENDYRNRIISVLNLQQNCSCVILCVVFHSHSKPTNSAVSGDIYVHLAIT